MPEYVYILSIAFCFLILVIIELRFTSSSGGAGALGRYVSHKGKYGILIDDQGHSTEAIGEQRPFSQSSSLEPLRCRFSVIIVTYNEALLNKTFVNKKRVMCIESTMYLRIPDLNICMRYVNLVNSSYEVLVIDDASSPPVTWDPLESRVRIVRSGQLYSWYINCRRATGTD